MHEFSLDCDKRARVMFSFGHFLFEEVARKAGLLRRAVNAALKSMALR
jgi:hypothetical protein